jgi:cobalamin biosynthesis Mg chelatase CobN
MSSGVSPTRRTYVVTALAVQAHGFLDRPSEDVDLFTTSAAEDHFPEALATVIAAYKADGLDVYITAENPGFAPL